MDFKDVNSLFINWHDISGVIHNGQIGTSVWKEVNTRSCRIGLAEYSPNYKSAQWCEKAHIVHCIEGELLIKLKNGNQYRLNTGNSLTLSPNDHHIAVTGESPAKIFVID